MKPIRILIHHTVHYANNYLKRVENDKKPSKHERLFIDSKQSNDPGEAKEREDDDERFEEFPTEQGQVLLLNDPLHVGHVHM